jgi:two-component system phosphate regulon sensor histidine kinase PhoR
MNTKKYRWLLYTITLTIVATIAVQVYWNYKNYQQNKQRVINEIQLSLDNAIEEYFADIVKNDFITIVDTQISNVDSSHTSQKNWKLKKRVFGWDTGNRKNIDTVFKDIDISINSHPGKRIKIVDSLFNDIKPNFISDVRIFRGKKSDSIKLINDLKTIYLSIKSDSVQYQKLDSLLKNQLNNKNLKIDYRLTHQKGDSIYFNSNNVRFNLRNKRNFFKRKKAYNNWNGVNSKSTFLRHNEQFEVLFKDSSFEALKRSSTGILLSFLLSLTIISCLFYLLKIINRQKQLAEIKNDLISNITHEFKTPITTVSTALEAIDTFNAIDDKEKTKKYLSISNEQLKKLHHMVEKLLETATLDSEKLLLKKEQTDIVALIKKLAAKDEFLATEKNIDFHSIKDSFITKVDAFHFENAINNLLDNAIKYGGNSIEVHISFVLNNIEITIADNGNGIEKNQREKIFDKFYRIPKGNTHNVKGFGIGLYYTKKIIEKHGGKIHLVPNSKNTIFKITLPV